MITIRQGGICIEVDIPYGKEMVRVSVQGSCDVLSPKKFEIGNEDARVSKALSLPIGKEPFSEFVKNAKRLLIIVTDATRPTPTAKVIGHLYPHISEHPDINFLIATGTHRPPTEKELGIIFGEFYHEFKDKIYVHDAKKEENLVYMGKTSRGTEVYFNKMATIVDSIVTINSVKPHYFAGFTGGRKSFLPGIASYKGIEMNHSYATSDEAQPMALKGNPVAEDMDEAAGLLRDKEIFSIQTVMTDDHRVYAVVSGDLSKSFERATLHAMKLYSVPLKARGNIVLTANPYPMDINLYQSQHALENSKLALEPRGIMILVSKCWDGVGNPSFLDLLDKVQNQEDVEAVLGKSCKLGYHKAVRIMKMKAYANLWAVTDLDDNAIRRSKMKPYHSIQRALDDAIELVRKIGMKPKVVIIPNGGMTVPYIATSEAKNIVSQ